ncbi:MAG: hypothetical protein ACREJ2_06195 [Planctomycetota bacterium]
MLDFTPSSRLRGLGIWALLLTLLCLRTAPAYDHAHLQALEAQVDAMLKDSDRAKKLPPTKPGEVADLECYFDHAYHYSVYLPKAYDPKVAWPVIFCDSPGGNARTYCEAYQAYADEFGWIIAGSKECSNNVTGEQQVDSDLNMVWDVVARYNVHSPMSIFLGFSGGARCSEKMVFWGGLPGMMGTIQMGAGQGPYPATHRKNLQVYIIVGTEDGNLKDCEQFAQQCRDAGHKVVLVEYKAGHQNAPPEMVRTAIQWQTETFLKTNADTSSDTQRLRKGYVEKFVQAAKDSEAAGDKVATYVKYRSAVETAQSIPLLGADEKKIINDIEWKTMPALKRDKAVAKEAQAYAELTRMEAWANGLPKTKMGLYNAPPQFQAIAEHYPDTPSGKTAAEVAKQYTDELAALKQ